MEREGRVGNRRRLPALRRVETICYIITVTENIAKFEILMASPPHRHPHPVMVSASLLRMSALQRLAVAGGVILVIWAAMFWAMS
jgi:hypothetical protein